MPEPLARREPRLPAVQQYPSSAPDRQIQAHLDQTVSLGLTVLDAKDHAFQEIERRVNKPGRSYSHQRNFAEVAGYTWHTLNTAMNEIYKGELVTIVNNQPRQREREVVTITRYAEVPVKKGLIGYLFR
jgi:hypothetical protein